MIPQVFLLSRIHPEKKHRCESAVVQTCGKASPNCLGAESSGDFFGGALFLPSNHARNIGTNAEEPGHFCNFTCLNIKKVLRIIGKLPKSATKNSHIFGMFHFIGIIEL